MLGAQIFVVLKMYYFFKNWFKKMSQRVEKQFKAPFKVDEEWIPLDESLD